ncbi:MAG: cytochrome C, partial [Gammaproteobacteria bacterium]|nr:cytochrome C [Gammaproteobacteria bacterium]
CHDGTTATGKTLNHIQTNDSCESCHSTVVWDTFLVDHNAVIGTCASCHDGTIATGKSITHVSTNAECDTCHVTTAWSPALFDHTIIVDNCASCHDGITATGQNVGHFGTAQECNTCHLTTSWLPDMFSHISANYPGDHRLNLACTDCHITNAEPVSWQFPAYAPDCAGCHAGDFVQDEHKKVDTPRINYTPSELRDCSGACHEYVDTTLSTIREFRTNEHRVSDNGFD